MIFHIWLGWTNYLTFSFVVMILYSVCLYPLFLMKAKFPHGEHNLVLTDVGCFWGRPECSSTAQQKTP